MEAEKRFTLHATDDVTGNAITFTDYCDEGADVELWREPEAERGFLGLKRLYVDDAGEWRLRELTDDERIARNARILGSSGVS